MGAVRLTRKYSSGSFSTPNLKLLDLVREVVRLEHNAIRTERSCVDWNRRYVKFHKMQARNNLDGWEAKVALL